MPADLVARFVDKIDASRQVRLNINDGRTWRLQDDTRFDPPQAKRSRSSTMARHGSAYPAAAYDDRKLELHLLLETDNTNQSAEQIQALARELDRRDDTGEHGNILEYQLPGATHPVFFRTYPIGLENIVYPTDGTQHWLTVPVLAEPFAYGLREDPVVAVTVNFDPAAANNGGFFDVTADKIKGDVETPVKLILPSTIASKVTLIGVRRRGTPSAVPFVLQAEAMTQGTDTSTQANDAAFSGSSNNWSRTTFATQTGMVDRLTMTAHPGTPSEDVRGTYRILGRLRSGAAQHAARIQLGPSDVVTSAGTVLLQVLGGTNIVMVDFGLGAFPTSQDPIVDMVTGTPIAVVGQLVTFQAQRVSGAGNLDEDFFLFVPADDRLAFIQWNAGTPTDFVLDGYNEVIYGRDASGRVISLTDSATYVGGPPMLTPNQAHRIFLIYDVGGSTSISTTHSVSMSYFPRYLNVRGPSG